MILFILLSALVSHAANDVVLRPQGVFTESSTTSQSAVNADLDEALQRAAQNLEVQTAEASINDTGPNNTTTADSEDQPLVSEKVKAEDATPLNLNKQESHTTSVYTRVATGLGLFALFAIAAFLGIRRWAQGRPTSRNKARIEVVSQYSLGAKRSLVIVHVAGESLLLGVTENNISLIKNLALIDDEVPEALPNNFGRALREVDSQGELEDDFAAGQLKDLRSLVSGKLKGLRTLA